MKSVALVCIMTLLSGCATPRGRFLVGSGIGAVAVGGTAIALSPNAESRGMNALVFGLVGALVGGLVGLFIKDDGEVPKADNSLKAKEQVNLEGSTKKYYEIPFSQDLPAWVKQRVQPPILEETVEKASVGEDGSLHEPHPTYRIHRSAELSADPIHSTNPDEPNKQ